MIDWSDMERTNNGGAVGPSLLPVATDSRILVEEGVPNEAAKQEGDTKQWMEDMTTVRSRTRGSLMCVSAILTNAVPLLSLLLLSLIFQPTATQGIEDHPLFGCAKLVTDLDFNFEYFDRYDEFFREDSVMLLAQAGTYKGVEAIKEYVGFTSSKISPYFKWDFPEDYAFQFNGLSDDGYCEVMTFHRNDYVFNESTATYAAAVGVTFMSKIFYDSENNYIPRIHIYYAGPWLDFFFGAMLSQLPTTSFLCQSVLTESCGWEIPNCLQELEALPALTLEGYADGDCLGCRALHGAFALTNPEGHCAHISLEPKEDPNGNIKCQTSTVIPVEELFTPQDLETFWNMSAKFGVNGTVGYIENAPYARSFQRVYEDALQQTPPVSALLQTLSFPGVAEDAYSDGPICPAFQNDSAYWTDFVALESSETHLDWLEARRLGASVIPGFKSRPLAANVVFGPGTCTVSYVNSTDIQKKLGQMPQRLQDGLAYRTNELGKNRLNSKTFQEGLWTDGYVGNSLGVPNEDHSVIRPVLDYLFGDGGAFGDIFADSGNRWSYSELVDSAKVFLASKDRIHSLNDPSVWVLQALQKIALDIDTTEAKMEAFKNLRDVAVYLAFLPENSVEKVVSSVGLDIELAFLWKQGNVDNYEEILSTSSVLEEVRELIGDDPVALKKASWAILDTFTFAGGLGVPNNILHAMAAYYKGFEVKPAVSVHDARDLKLLVLEAIRRFPPVSSVPTMDARDHHRSLQFVAAVGYEESVYGANVKDFKIRGDLQWYHERSLHFAEPALPVDDDSPETARICPGRSLAVAMAAAWLEALDLEKWCVDIETPIKNLPLEYDNFELIRIGSEGGACLVDSEDASAAKRTSSYAVLIVSAVCSVTLIFVV